LSFARESDIELALGAIVDLAEPRAIERPING